MKKAWAMSAMAVCFGFIHAPAASADEPFKFDEFFKMADANRDGMMSRQEFINAAGKRYDAMVAKMKKMPADKGGAMMKGELMTREGARNFIDEWKGYSGS